MRDAVCFYINGKAAAVRGADVFQPLSTYLRQGCRLTGTKVVCAEGDCGSCTVLLGRPGDEGLRYRAVTSCIQYVYQLDGTHVVTVEGLQAAGGLHPCQEAMVTCHGAQCGYCTPGFVVAMTGLLEENETLSTGTLRRGLTGNLCRCTGYEAILKAGMAINAGTVQRINALYPPAAMAKAIGEWRRESLQIAAHAKTVFKPATLGEALEFRRDHPGCTIVAGGTDLGVVINKGKIDPQTILVTTTIDELRGVAVHDGVMRLGANATLREWELAARNVLPAAAEMLDRHGSPLIRNAATLAGNIVNGSPIGDSMPLLFVLDATLELASTRGRRSVNINQFYTGYRKSVLRPDELLVGITMPIPAADVSVRFFKVSKRQDLDISSFSAAFRMVRAGARISEIAVALGGVAATIVRLPKAEAFLRGQSVNDDAMIQAGEIAADEVTPLSDVRGTAAFRRQLVINLFQRFAASLEEPDATTGAAALRLPISVNRHSNNGHSKATLPAGGR
jgi:xanthine dehydrogenase small subunit